MVPGVTIVVSLHAWVLQDQSGAILRKTQGLLSGCAVSPTHHASGFVGAFRVYVR